MEITIKIDQRSKQAKLFYEYMKTLPFIEFQEPRYNVETENAIRDAKSGNSEKISLKDFRKELYS